MKFFGRLVAARKRTTPAECVFDFSFSLCRNISRNAMRNACCRAGFRCSSRHHFFRSPLRRFFKQLLHHFVPLNRLFLFFFQLLFEFSQLKRDFFVHTETHLFSPPPGRRLTRTLHSLHILVPHASPSQKAPARVLT